LRRGSRGISTRASPMGTSSTLLTAIWVTRTTSTCSVTRTKWDPCPGVLSIAAHAHAQPGFLARLGGGLLIEVPAAECSGVAQDRSDACVGRRGIWRRRSRRRLCRTPSARSPRCARPGTTQKYPFSPRSSAARLPASNARVRMPRMGPPRGSTRLPAVLARPPARPPALLPGRYADRFEGAQRRARAWRTALRRRR